MNRRDFLRLSGAGSTGVVLGLSACTGKEKFVLATLPDEERIKVGVIGLGDRGSAILNVLQNVPEFKVVALCDIFDFRLENAKKKVANEVKTYKNYRELLEQPELEAVIIATPLHLHHSMVMEALDRDIHILSEKALAHSIEECNQIKTAAEGSTKQFQVSYQYQLNPMFQAIKQIIDNGYLGTLTRIEATWDRNGDWRRKLPPADVAHELKGVDLERMINWRMYKEYSGGLNAELGSHQFNMISNILGSSPTKVVGTGGIDYWKDGRETLDNVHVLFDHPGGVKVGFHSGTTNKFEGFRMKFYGTLATIDSEEMSSAHLYAEDMEIDEEWKDNIDSVTGASVKIINRDKRRAIKPPAENEIIYPTDNNYYNTTWLLYKNFAAAIKGEEKLLLGLEEGYKSAVTVHLANMAAREGRAVEWDAEVPAG